MKDYRSLKYDLEKIREALKDWGIDWILEERGSSFEGLMGEITLALGGVVYD